MYPLIVSSHNVCYDLQMYKLGSLIIGIILPYILFWLVGVIRQVLNLGNITVPGPWIITQILIGAVILWISWLVARALSKKEPQVFNLRMMLIGISVTAACWLLILPLLEG